MGDLITKTPYSEITATLEMLDRAGIRREHLEQYRKASPRFQQQIARALISGGEEFFSSSGLLQQAIRVTILAPRGSFSVRESFGAKNPPMKLRLTPSFKTKFLDKVESGLPSVELLLRVLASDCTDTRILDELGVGAEIALAYLWILLMRQSDGRPGPLLTDGRPNACYIKDGNGMRWAVDALWSVNWHCGGGWSVDAHLTGDAWWKRADWQIISLA